MRRPNLMDCLAVVFAVVLSAVGAEQVCAAGYWNMPGTFAQRTGHGYGGGYHAPLMLGPVRCDGWGLGTPVRLPCAPSPYCGCGSHGGDCGRTVEAPPVRLQWRAVQRHLRSADLPAARHRWIRRFNNSRVRATVAIRP